MEIEALSLYDLQATAAGIMLVQQGEVDLSEFNAILNPSVASIALAGEADGKTTVFTKIGPGNHKRFDLKLLPSVRGPADKKHVPVLLDLQAPFESGVAVSPVFDLAPRPADPPGVFPGNRGWNPNRFVSHLSWYGLQRKEDGTFQCRFLYNVDAEEYVAKHLLPLRIKLPALLKELEDLRKLLTDRLVSVRKDRDTMKVSPESAKIGEEAFITLRAKHNANIELVIEALEADHYYYVTSRTKVRRAFEEENAAIGVFQAWYEQRDLPPEKQAKHSVWNDATKKLVDLMERSTEDMREEYRKKNDKGKESFRRQLRANDFGPWHDVRTEN